MNVAARQSVSDCFFCIQDSFLFAAQILQIKNEQGRHKPLSLLCKDISTMNTYAKGIDKVRKRPQFLPTHTPFAGNLVSTSTLNLDCCILATA